MLDDDDVSLNIATDKIEKLALRIIIAKNIPALVLRSCIIYRNGKPIKKGSSAK